MSIRRLDNFVGGSWIEPQRHDWLDVENPTSCEPIALVPLSTDAEVDRAVVAAAEAFPQWSSMPVARRCDLLFNLVELLRRNEEELTRLITLENGKSLPDSRAEVKRALENTQVACGMPVLQQGDKLIGGAKDIDGEVLKLPLGAFGMIAPFNFPLMVPFWFFPYALATGNTYIVKPSEQTPLSMTRVAELIAEAGFPPGVFNIVHGDRRAAERLLQSPQIQGISFVGTSRVGRIVAEQCTKKRKRFQALGGEKPPGRHARREDGRDDSQHGHLLLRLRRPAMYGVVGDRGRGGAHV